MKTSVKRPKSAKVETDPTGMLVVTPRTDHVLFALEALADGRLDVYCPNTVDAMSQRTLGKILQAEWLEPLATMIRLGSRVWSYRLVVNYYSRNGYWLGILRSLRRIDAATTFAWVGFAPNPPRAGVIGCLREIITYRALLGFDVVVCNTLPTIEASRRRYPKVADRFAYARWGGTDALDQAAPQDLGYVFAGGRTNRDFRTVYQAVTDLRLPAVFVVGRDVHFPSGSSDNVIICRDTPPEEFQRLLEGARIVVIALDHPEVSSGQVVLNRAMRSAKPVIVTRTAGIDEYVTDGTDGVLVAAHDVDQMKAELARLFGDRELRSELGLAGRRTYETRFNERVFASELAALLGIAAG